ncbi:MAG: septal ring lytic transglycosylase RlpA family protein [Desulforhopalus sp.]
MIFLSSVFFSRKTLCFISFPALLILSTILSVFLVSISEASGYRPHPTQRPYVIKNKKYYPIPSAEGYSEQGIASWYGGKFHGRKTSNGEVYNMNSMTAAHKTLPMNTMLLVKNLENGKETVVRINDRGPFVRGRIVDLSYHAAKIIGIDRKGISRVQATALGEAAVNKYGVSSTLVYTDLSVGEFYVQIGAFIEKNNATRLQKRFTDAGHATVIRKSSEPESIIYRVHVFAGNTMYDAKRAEKALLERGYKGAFIIAN